MNQNISINKKQSAQRLDKFLAGFDAQKSRSAWQKKIQNEEILVNGKKVKADYTLKEKDEITILPDGEKLEKKKTPIPDIKIVYEDQDIIVIDKPIGVLSQSATSSSSPAVSDFLIKHFPKIKEVGEDEQRFGIVHRLDKDTSGVMIVAKNNESFLFLKEQFKNHKTKKIYTALVHGTIEPREGSIDFKIGRSKTNPQIQTAIDSKKKESIKSREALTLYKTIKSFQDYSLLTVEIKTGRMHQIRVHMKAIGHPIIGDQKYNLKKFVNKNRELKRQFLHASEMTVTLPSGELKTFRSDLPADLKVLLKSISS
jgi:23S rRNA pseudouridine1911/1915/1917 synthase